MGGRIMAKVVMVWYGGLNFARPEEEGVLFPERG